MLIAELQKSNGLRRKSKRLGRGNASGKGNYSTKGLKGQKARSGRSRAAGFEGGQTKLAQRLPKLKGFKRYFKLQDKFEIVNLGRLDLDTRIENNAIITKQLLIDLNYITKAKLPIKILCKGELNKSLIFQGIEYFSESAKQNILKANGKIESKI